MLPLPPCLGRMRSCDIKGVPKSTQRSVDWLVDGHRMKSVLGLAWVDEGALVPMACWAITATADTG